MKKIVTIACAAVACMSFAIGLSACKDDEAVKVSSLKTMNPVYQKYESETVFTKAEKITNLSGYTYDYKTYGNFKKLSRKTEDGKDGSLALFNTSTGESIIFNDEDTANISKTWSFSAFSYYCANYSSEQFAKNIVIATLNHNDYSNYSNSYTMTYFYDAKGNKIAETKASLYGSIYIDTVDSEGETLYSFAVEQLDGSEDTYYVNAKGIQVDYSGNENTIDDIFKPSMNVDNYNIQKVKGENGGYLYYDEEDNKYISYAKDLTVLHTLDLPFDAEVNAEILFDSGNYVLQYIMLQPMDAEEYDFILEGQKATMKTVLVNVAKNSTKELDCKFVLGFNSLGEENVMTPASIAEDGEEWNLTEGVVAYFKGIGEISEDKRLDFNHNREWFGITEDGSLRRAQSITQAVEAERIMQVLGGNFIVEDIVGRYYVVSADGKQVKEINADAINSNSVGGNDYYIQMGKDFYDTSFNKVYTLPNDYEVEEWLNGAVVLKETIDGGDNGDSYKWYILKNGETTLVASSAKGESVYFYSYGGFRVTKSINDNGFDSYTCTYYNENGDKVTDVNNQHIIQDAIGQNEDGSVIYVTYVTYDENQQVKERSILKLS